MKEPLPHRCRSRFAEYVQILDAKALAQEDGKGGDADTPSAFEHFCTEVESTPLWGSQLELGALAHALERHISVYSVGLPVVEMGEEYKGLATCCSIRQFAFDDD